MLSIGCLGTLVMIAGASLGVVAIVFSAIKRSDVYQTAIQTARSRSMESATGLLYINVGTIAAGTILAAGLYFGAGLLV